MSAPNRRNGIDMAELVRMEASIAASRVRSCENKTRYACEHGVRAAGTLQMGKRGAQLYFYPCTNCRGDHLTHRPRQAFYAVNYYENKK